LDLILGDGGDVVWIDELLNYKQTIKVPGMGLIVRKNGDVKGG
jgi:hypothetical protein